MNIDPEAVLALLSDLTSRLARAEAEGAQLREENEGLRERLLQTAADGQTDEA